MNAEATKAVKPLNPPAGHKASDKPAAETASTAPIKPPKGEKQPKAPKPPKEPRESNFAKVYPETAVITLKVEKNPKREGSAARERFALYTNGMTVGAALKVGVTYADISWDVGHGFISVAAAATPATPAASA